MFAPNLPLGAAGVCCHGATPPLKRLPLAPGQHTIRIVNPNFPEHTVMVNAVKGASAVIEMDFTEEEVE